MILLHWHTCCSLSRQRKARQGDAEGEVVAAVVQKLIRRWFFCFSLLAERCTSGGVLSRSLGGMLGTDCISECPGAVVEAVLRGGLCVVRQMVVGKLLRDS